MTLFYYEEMSLEEIGEAVGLKLDTVAHLHTKASLRMRNEQLERDANKGAADA